MDKRDNYQSIFLPTAISTIRKGHCAINSEKVIVYAQKKNLVLPKGSYMLALNYLHQILQMHSQTHDYCKGEIVEIQ